MAPVEPRRRACHVALMARCPMCRATVSEGGPALPFCSERCRLLDLGNWLDQRYAIPAPEDESASPEAGGDDSADPTGEASGDASGDVTGQARESGRPHRPRPGGPRF